MTINEVATYQKYLDICLCGVCLHVPTKMMVLGHLHDKMKQKVVDTKYQRTQDHDAIVNNTHCQLLWLLALAMAMWFWATWSMASIKFCRVFDRYDVKYKQFWTRKKAKFSITTLNLPSL